MFRAAMTRSYTHKDSASRVQTTSAREPNADAVMVALAAHLRHQADRLMTLAELAHLSGLSPSQVQRRFSRAMGCSPKAWQRACRERLLKERLRQGEDLAGAIYGAGYGSGSRVYESAGARLGMTPGQYADGGVGVAISVAVTRSSLGLVLIAATNRGICAVYLGDDEAALRRDLRAEFPAARFSNMPRRSRGELARWMAYVSAVLGGAEPSNAVRPSTVPLAPRGTDFQLRVWELLRRIPAGQTRTYAEVARELGQPSAARAVARACATNPIAVLIPCHRVIRGDGELAGYRWGIGRKRRMLRLERSTETVRASSRK